MTSLFTFIRTTVVFVEMWTVVDGGLEADALDVVVGEDGSDQSESRAHRRIESSGKSELLADHIRLIS